MGLDYVELIMATEETFGIEITDEEAQNATTPGKLLDVVMSKIQVADEAGCLTQQSFYLFRRACVQTLGIKRNEIRPDTSLAKLISENERPLKWGQLKDAVGAATWPKLVRSGSVNAAIMALSFAAFVMTAVPVKAQPALILLACVPAACLTAWLCVTATKKLRLHYPYGLNNAGDVAKYIASRQRFLLLESPKRWNREIAWQKLQNLIREHLGVTEFNEDSHFYRDLGAG